MKRSEIGNLSQGRLKRHAAFVVPSFLVALSLAGVVIRPNLSLTAAEQDLHQAEERVQERQVHAQHLQRLQTEAGLERAAAVLAAVRRMVPVPLPKLELHGLLRLIAERSGVELAGLELMEPHDPGLERLDDVVALREVRVEGQSTIRALLGALNAFQALGRPVALLEFHASRAEQPGRYQWTVMLGLFETRSLAEFEPDEGLSAEVGQGRTGVR